MSSSGVSRTVDKMGRVVIPKEIRDQLKIVSEVDKIDITVDGDKIILKKHYDACLFCGKIEDAIEYKGYYVCNDCVEKLKNINDESEIEK